MNFKKFVLNPIPVLLISIAVFLFGALALITPSGYTYGPLLLLFPALGFLVVRPYPALNSQDKILIIALLIYFVVGVITNLVHHLPSRSYDNFSRFLFAVPVLLLLLRFPIKPIFLWSGIAFGAIGAALMALIDFYVNGQLRVEGYNNPIQFGDIAMLFACLLLAGFSWATQSKYMTTIFVVGIAGGIFASLMSGARGGWLALPIAVGFFYSAHNVHKNNKHLFIFLGALLCLAVVIYLFQQSGLLDVRVQEAMSDWQQYTQAQNANTSLGIRFTLWHKGLNLFAQHPLLGWGSVENYVHITGDSSEIFQRFNHFHNEFLDAMVKRGLVGGSALFFIYWLPARVFYRQLKQSSMQTKPLAYAALMLVLATFAFGLTQSFFCHASGVMIYAFMLVILWAQIRTSETASE